MNGTPERTAYGTDHTHQDDGRLISEAELESLLSWWRTTAKDRYDQPLFCSHHEHFGACRECANPE